VLNHLEAVFFINHLYFSIDFRERCMLIIINNLMEGILSKVSWKELLSLRLVVL